MTPTGEHIVSIDTVHSFLYSVISKGLEIKIALMALFRVSPQKATLVNEQPLICKIDSSTGVIP